MDELEDKTRIAEEIGKRVAWDLLDASKDMDNLSSYTRSVIRKQSCDLLSKKPSKDLVIKYGIKLDRGYLSIVWWLLEELDKGNIIIKDENIQPKP